MKLEVFTEILNKLRKQSDKEHDKNGKIHADK